MSGSQTTSGIPAIAAAVGYDTETFGPAINVGTTPNPTTSYPQFTNGANMVPFDFLGTSWTNIGETNSNGSVTLDGTGETYGNGLATASVTPPGQTLNGIAFGGGGYFQVTMSGNGPMSFWMNDAATMNGASNGTGVNAEDSWVEADIAEFDTPGAYGFTLHNWYGAVGSGDVVNANENGASPPGANYTQPNNYGMLWVPATATTQGYVKFYFNGQQVGNTVTWNQYVPGQSAPANPFAVMDVNDMIPILGAGPGTTATFSNLEVWQASASSDIGTGVAAASTPTPTPTPTPSVTPSANDTVVHAGTASAITDGSGNAWTITSGGQVAINGTADTTTSNVTELAYVNGEVWQENTSGWWWGKTSPTAAWSPGPGTTTSPLPVTPTPTPTPTPAPTPTPTSNELTPTSGGTLKDATGNTWTLTSAGVVDENGTAVPGGSGTSALAIVSNVIYGEDATSKSWYTYSTTSQSWTSSAAPVLTATPTPTPTPTVTPSANDTVVHAGAVSAITDSSGNAWTITSGGQVAIDGTADTTTSNVTELAYVNGEVWQENTSGWWWGKTSPTAAWSPGPGTTTSPLPVTPTPTPTPAPTPSPTPPATPTELTPTSGGTLTDGAGNKWTLTSAAVVDENGTAVPGGSGTSALAVVSNLVYGEDATSKSWYTYSTSSHSWTSSGAPVLSSTVTIAANQASTTVSGNAVSVNATSGNHMVFIRGTGDTVSLSGGTDTITDTGSGNTYVLPAAGKGYDTFSNDVLKSTDNLDLRTALAATNWSGSATTLSNYLTVTNSSQGAVLSIAPTSSGTATGIATIEGATGTTLSGLLAHALT